MDMGEMGVRYQRVLRPAFCVLRELLALDFTSREQLSPSAQHTARTSLFTRSTQDAGLRAQHFDLRSRAPHRNSFSAHRTQDAGRRTCFSTISAQQAERKTGGRA